MTTRKTTLASALALSLALALLAPDAHAVKAPSERISSGGIELAPGLPPLRREVTVSYSQIPKQRKTAWETFLDDVGSKRWQVLWDTSTATPLRIFGEGVPAPMTVASAAAAEKHARSFIERHKDLLAPGVAMESLELAANQVDHGMRTVALYQRAPLGKDAASGSVPVIHGQISLRYKNDRLFVIASEVIPFARATPKTVDAKTAEAAAKAWMHEQFDSIAISGKTELVVLPLIRERGVQAVTAWRVPMKAGSMPLPYDVYIDASLGKPVARDMLGRFAQGTAEFDVGERYPQGARKPFPPRLVDITVDGAISATDASGVFTWPGASPATVDLTVHGEDSFVHNAQGPDATVTMTVPDGGTAQWSMADDQYGDAQLTTFIHAAIVKQRARLIAPTMNFLFDKLTINVNRDEKQYQCNAFWDGSGVNFFVQFGPCNNTGRVADVIYHEFGHGFHQNALIAGAGLPDPALGEGQSDYLACTTTGDSNMAPGFFTSGDVLRRCQNDRRWPKDINSDPHETGLIFTGAMWDLRANLVNDLGEAEGVPMADALYYAAIQRATSVPATYAEVIAADDDDGDLANGTPHICAINAAFVAHGLSPYLSAGGLILHHDALSLVKYTTDPLSVKVSQELLFPGCGAAPISNIKLLWGPKSTTNNVDMAAQGDDYVGDIPPQADGSALRYRIIATVDGHQYTLPDNPADPEYRVFVGDVTPLYCNDFEENADGWVFTSASGGAGDFKWGSPGGLADDPETAYSGDRAIGNDLTLNGLYSPNKTSYADSPVVDLAGNQHIRLQFRRWLSVEDGYFDQANIAVNGKQVWENEATGEQFGQLNHIDKEWRFEDIDISWVPLGGATSVGVRFALEADDYYEAGGWTIDDFCIVAWNPVTEDAGAGGGGGGGGAPETTPEPPVDDSCGCRAVGSSGSVWALSPLSALALIFAARRRSRARGRRA